MVLTEWVLLLVFTGVFVCLMPLLGTYINHVFSDRISTSSGFLGWLEKLCYYAGGIHPIKEMTWQDYAKSMFLFNIFGFLFLFLLQLFQAFLPLNPQHFENVAWPLAFNTAISFVTNTNWQSYAGETTLSYFTQMLGMTSQNFLSAATGMGALLVLIRGIARQTADTVGNFWTDLVRMVVYLLIPFSTGIALLLVSEGVIQNLSPYIEVTTLEKTKQTIPMGPVASQIAIKQLGSNGGGFFNANSTHPFENPTLLSNFLEMLAILLIPAACVYAYGIMTRSKKHAFLLFFVMLIFWLGGILVSALSEYLYNPVLEAYPILEGKETRFGIPNSLLWSVSTTATANGSVNAMMSSLSPLAGGVALLNMMLGELIFGGIGVGLCSMLMMAILAVFLAGLMVGRTPEYLGKKIGKQEIQWVMVAVLTPGALVLLAAGISILLPEVSSGVMQQGPHGLTEILYAFSSAAVNNGSAFAGLNTNTTYYNLVLGLVMLLGRISIILPSLAIAGLLAEKKTIPPSVGTFSTSSVIFFIILASVILIVSALTFFPALSLGPIVEHLLMLEGQAF